MHVSSRDSALGLQRHKTEEFGFELSNLYITKENFVDVFCSKLDTHSPGAMLPSFKCA
jgi:hypothetical protein